MKKRNGLIVFRVCPMALVSDRNEDGWVTKMSDSTFLIYAVKVSTLKGEFNAAQPANANYSSIQRRTAS